MEPEAPTMGKSSKINSGMLQVFRLDFLWKKANDYAIAGQYKKWNDVLDRIWCELAGDVTEKEDFEKFQSLTKSYANSIKIKSSKKGFGDFTNVALSSMVSQRAKLMEKEIFLRSLQNTQGKGTAYDDEDEFDF